MKNIIKVICIVLLSAFSTELASRALISIKQNKNEWIPPIFPDFESSEGPGVYTSHPYTAYKMKPKSTVVRNDDYQDALDGGHQNYVNSDGFRNDKEFAQDHPGVVRILCLGSSTTYGVRNSYNDSYPSYLERFLNSHDTDHTYEVINAGLVSSTTAEHSARLPRMLIEKRPDVVVFYEGFNDLVPRIFNNYASDYSHFRKTPSSINIPYITNILRNSFFARIFIKNVFGDLTLHDYIINMKNLPSTEEEKISNFYRNGTKVFEENIEFLIRVSKAYDARFILPSFAFIPGKNDFWVSFFPNSLWEEGIRQNNDVTRKLSDKYSLKRPDLNSFFKNHPDVFLGKIHFNAEGNRLMAQEIGAQILEQ